MAATEEVFDDYDSDLLLSSDDEEKEKNVKVKTEIKVRVDQYLTTCELGRLAWKAGDAQLAKDRFITAMNLELSSEIESVNDFGVTGGILRDELISRNKSKTVNELMASRDDRLQATVAKLQKIFVEADEKAALNTANTESFLLMGAALSMIGEIDKAEAVYKEGIAACPSPGSCPKLVEALKRINKLKDVMSLVGPMGCNMDIDTSSNNRTRQQTSRQSKKPTPPESITLHFPKKSKREHIKSVIFEEPPLGGVPRSRSFSSDLTDSAGNLPLPSPTNNRPTSPLVGNHSPLVKRKTGLTRIFKKDKWRPKSSITFVNGVSPSNSMEDLVDAFEQLGAWRERSTWKKLFQFEKVKESLQGFDSRTINTMRVMVHTAAPAVPSKTKNDCKRYWY